MEIQNLIERHDIWRSNCINLVASENKMSPMTSSALKSDMGHRYFFKNVFQTDTGIQYNYRGAKFIKEMYFAVEEVAKRLFNANYVNLEMLSGHLANINVIFSYCKPGDTIICTDTRFGGYPGLAPGKMPDYLGVKVDYFPQKEVAGEIDLQALEKKIREISPKVVMLSSSMTLFPFPVKEVSDLCHKYSIPFCYDASHPLGLIAGGQFQLPFDEGADLIIGSTHKSFPGPQGGIILGKEGNLNIEAATDFVVVDNIHVNRIAALGIALYEMEVFGQDYAKQVVKNSKALAQELDNLGFEVAFKNRGFTESHQFLIKKGDLNYSLFCQNMESIGIILDESGRIGVSEVTRLGMSEVEMKTIASFFKSVSIGECGPILSKNVEEFMRDFKSVRYCFECE